ncbi:hypothetical protein P168DRAFT_292877 [Aspergillus campestris IBT 28561]|uniref:Cupin type-2 domain-containing protein n=1 Tax=Aspergillus campestris (strain IBT 28561) TaxID=1392248 RepID=A0A2I1CW20_ASPC2|nr:uncharacterized protein P168DRAFT_292877 [Aspergillus campestris IBT 28561]PKY01820.1 hypothetical protein P168DRAFT_292877 [Aspergillus campestris IBT 28561]
MSTPQARVQPETYYLQKGTFVPNNRLPALVYRGVLPRPLSRESTKALCERNHWERRGEWGAIWEAHFHPNTHECYGVLQGQSILVLGRERHAESTGGVEVDVRAGDVVVVPAGVSHRSLSATDDYRYMGVYPEQCPRWRNDFCKGTEAMDKLEEDIRKVIIPDHDPVYGLDGPLVVLWREASRGSKL